MARSAIPFCHGDPFEVLTDLIPEAAKKPWNPSQTNTGSLS